MIAITIDDGVDIMEVPTQKSPKKRQEKTLVDVDKFKFDQLGRVSTPNITQSGAIYFEWSGPNEGDWHREQMPLIPFCFFVKIILDASELSDGLWQALHLAIAGFNLSGHTFQRKDEERIENAINGLYHTLYQWPTVEDFLTEYNYVVLRNKQVTYDEAANYTSMILGRGIAKDALRMRVRKFAREVGLPPVEMRKYTAPLD